jgi:hypothetical protein
MNLNYRKMIKLSNGKIINDQRLTAALMEFFFFSVLLENIELLSLDLVLSRLFCSARESSKSMMTVALFECSESLKSRREAYDIF